MRVPRALRRNARMLAVAGSTYAVAALGGCKDFGSPLPPPTRVKSVKIVSPGPGSPAMRPGGSLRFTAEAQDSIGQLVSDATVEWTSSRAGVAQMATSGAVTGVATGIAVGAAAIRATSGGVQSDSVLVEVSTDAPAYATAQVEGLFVRSCAVGSGCHGSTFPSNNLHLEAALAYDNIVGVRAVVGSLLRVKPGDPGQSLIYLKVDSDAPPGGGQRMPQGGRLTDQEIAGLRAWIDAGAPR